MKKLVLVGIGLFMMAGFLPAKEHATNSHIECFGTTCGFTFCADYGRDLTNDERLWVYDTAEMIFCD